MPTTASAPLSPGAGHHDAVQTNPTPTSSRPSTMVRGQHGLSADSALVIAIGAMVVLLAGSRSSSGAMRGDGPARPPRRTRREWGMPESAPAAGSKAGRPSPASCARPSVSGVSGGGRGGRPGWGRWRHDLRVVRCAPISPVPGQAASRRRFLARMSWRSTVRGVAPSWAAISV